MTATNHTTSRRPLSLSGFLILLSGCGFVYLYVRFSEVLKSWGQGGRLLLFSAACLMVLVGAKQMLNSLWPDQKAAQARRLSRHRVLLPREGATYLLIMAVLFVGSLLGRSNTLMLVFAMMPGPFFLNGWIVFTMLKRIHVERRGPRRVMAGDAVSVEISLKNRNRWLSARLMAVRDHLEHPREQLDADVLFARVPPGREHSSHYQLRLMRRGRYRFGQLYVSSRFPLGLVERGLVFDSPGEILVHPRIGRLTDYWKKQHQNSTELAYQRKPQRGTFDDEFHRLREYRPGDNPQSIHWRTSARRNELIVREFHQSRDQHLIVLLDLWRPAQATEEHRERVELAISFAATLCMQHLRESLDSNLCIEVGGKESISWQGSAGPASIESMLDMFALLRAGPSKDMAALMQRCQERSSPHSKVVIITTRPRTDRTFPGLDEFLTHRRGAGANGNWQIVEANHHELGLFFQLD